MTVYTLLLAAGVFLALTAVQEHAALDEPVHWGTYRETLWECTVGREGRTCTSTGTWTSDDGGTVAHDVEFDGFDDDDGAHPGDAVRAGYRTFDADDDGLPATVWDEEGIDQTWIPQRCSRWGSQRSRWCSPVSGATSSASRSAGAGDLIGRRT